MCFLEKNVQYVLDWMSFIQYYNLLLLSFLGEEHSLQ